MYLYYYNDQLSIAVKAYQKTFLQLKFNIRDRIAYYIDKYFQVLQKPFNKPYEKY